MGHLTVDVYFQGTVVLRRWENETRKSGIKRVDNGQINTERLLGSCRLEPSHLTFSSFSYISTYHTTVQAFNNHAF